MDLVVLKFGGTSLANTKLMNNAIVKVLEEVAHGYKVVVVVSAMAGVTDHLVSLVHEITDLENKNESLEYASVITTGEQVSAGLFSLLLQQKGLKTRSWLGWQAGIITDDDVVDGNIIDIKTEEINQFFIDGNQVAVVAGFQGVTRDGRISTLGRGGSDTTAIILAGHMDAVKCDIYTDVDGVFTADPRVVPKAQKLKTINYDEMIAFSHAGAKVLQEKSAKWAKYYQVKLHILSSFSNNSGTLVNDFASHYIAGVALKMDKSVNGLEIAKISVINTAENNDLLESIVQTLKSNFIEILDVEYDLMSIIFIVKEEDKFEAVKIIHTACELEENYK